MVKLLKGIVCVGVMLGGLSMAIAQTPVPSEPVFGSEATPTPPQVEAPVVPATALPPGFGGEDGVYRILVVGDGLAGGLGAGITRMAENESSIEVFNRFNESSGLARPEVYDWPAALPKIATDKQLDAIVVLLGVNDRQGIRDGNIRHVFKAPGWVAAYTAAVDRLLDTAKATNAKVYWISLPPMADAGFNADMRFLSDIHQARVAAADQNFVDVRPFFAAPDGSFVDRGPDDTGVEHKLRERNGVDFMKRGNNRFGQLVLGTIKTLEGLAVPAPAPSAVIPEAAPSVAVVAPLAKPVIEDVVTIVPVPPSFGQTGLDGTDEAFRADAVQPVAKAPVSVANRNVDGSGFAQDVRKIRALQGTAAQRLFEEGVTTVAPAGRFDDFSVP